VSESECNSMSDAKVQIQEWSNTLIQGSSRFAEVRAFLCWSCSSLVGAKRGDSNKKGLQFFKYKISTHESVLSSGNILRWVDSFPVEFFSCSKVFIFPCVLSCSKVIVYRLFLFTGSTLLKDCSRTN
jgi:hypothetical protein